MTPPFTAGDLEALRQRAAKSRQVREMLGGLQQSGNYDPARGMFGLSPQMVSQVRATAGLPSALPKVPQVSSTAPPEPPALKMLSTEPPELPMPQRSSTGRLPFSWSPLTAAMARIKAGIGW
jgi:hypothetical protein